MKKNEGKPLAEYDRMEIAKAAGRIMELPEAMAKLSRQIAGIKMNVKGEEQQLKMLENDVLQECLLDEEHRYNHAKNKEARDSYLKADQDKDPALKKLRKTVLGRQARLETLRAEHDGLYQERTALKAFLEAYAADVQREMQRERQLKDFALNPIGVQA